MENDFQAAFLAVYMKDLWTYDDWVFSMMESHNKNIPKNEHILL